MLETDCYKQFQPLLVSRQSGNQANILKFSHKSAALLQALCSFKIRNALVTAHWLQTALSWKRMDFVTVCRNTNAVSVTKAFSPNSTKNVRFCLAKRFSHISLHAVCHPAKQLVTHKLAVRQMNNGALISQLHESTQQIPMQLRADCVELVCKMRAWNAPEAHSNFHLEKWGKCNLIAVLI